MVSRIAESAPRTLERPERENNPPAVAAEGRIDDARIHGPDVLVGEPVAQAARLDEVGQEDVDLLAAPREELVNTPDPHDHPIRWHVALRFR